MDDRYSSEFQAIKLTDCEPALRSALQELQRTNSRLPLEIFNYKEYMVAGFPLQVSLPSRGPVDGIDIRPVELVLVFFHKAGYPGRAPQIRVDRRSFPTERLPHLNPVWPGEPPWLCLHRGSVNDWYSEHSIGDLVERARSWLEDAARGKLIKDRDRFEPTRIAPEYWLGASVFDQRLFQDYITEQWRIHQTGGVAYVTSYLSAEKTDFEWYRLSSNDIAPSPDLIQPHRSEKEDGKHEPGLLYTGLLLWPDPAYKCPRYFGTLPTTVPELNAFAQFVGIPLEQHLAPALATGSSPKGRLIPVFLCIQRPLKLIGSESDLEILSFICFSQDANCPERAIILPHRDPLTPRFARHLSGLSPASPARVMLIGCGALGSKIGMHLGREGLTELTLVDDDLLSPHNFVRHALTESSRGLNKAEALKNAIQGLYRESHQLANTTAIPNSAFEFLHESDGRVFKDHRLVIDATASIATYMSLVENVSNRVPRVVRSEMAEGGRLGMMLVEGRGRSPKLDDVRASLYDLALENVQIERWLNGFQNREDDELGAGLEDITIGIGCSSPTMRVPDDLVSYHAASQSVAIRNLMNGTIPAGGILLSSIEGEIFPQGSVQFYPIEKFRTLIPQRPSGWRVRIRQDLIDQLIHQAQEAAPNETGGILIGMVATKQRTIYITRLLDAPGDSEHCPYAFKMGVNDIPDQVRTIMQKTGNLIRYVGEWHSHPQGPSSLSQKDQETVQQLRTYLNKIGMPTLVMVVTPRGCYPHLSLPI